jgi:hypothetical protein
MAMAVNKTREDKTRSGSDVGACAWQSHAGAWCLRDFVASAMRGAQVNLGDRITFDLDRTEPDRSIRQKHKDVFKFHLCFPFKNF